MAQARGVLARLRTALAGAAPDSDSRMSADPLSAADGPKTTGERQAASVGGAVRRHRNAKDELLDVLAAKVLMGYLRNRHQLFGPPPIDFGDLDPDQAELLVRAMIAAAQADGRLDAQEKDRIRDAAERIGLAKSRPGLLAEALRVATPLNELLRNVRDPHMASRFYAASVLALDKHLAVNRAYLGYLAQRLQLPADVVDQVHRQFGFGG